MHKLAVVLALALAPAAAFSPTLARAAPRAAPLGVATLEVATDPAVFLQGNVAEPRSVSDIPAAAAYLSTTFKEPFVVQNRADAGYLAASQKKPVLELSQLKEIAVDADGSAAVLDAGVTVDAFVLELRKSPQSSYADLLAGLPYDSKATMLDAVLDEDNKQLRACVKEVRVVRQDGTVASVAVDAVDTAKEIAVQVVLVPPAGAAAAPKEGVIARWYTRKFGMEGSPGKLPDSASLMIYKRGMFNSNPTVMVRVDGSKELNLDKNEWVERTANTPDELWERRNELATEARFDALTASATLAGEVPPLDTIVGAVRNRDEHLLVEVNKGVLRAYYDPDYPPDVDDDDLSQLVFKTDGLTKTEKVCVTRPRIFEPTFTVKTPVKEPARGTVIPDFSGEVYDITSSAFADKKYQYATSSYNNIMRPALVAYPRTEEDVAAAIKYATSMEPRYVEARTTIARPSGEPMKVMGRGGGHQYCGTSCPMDALVLSMEFFDKTELLNVDLKGVTGPDGEPHDVKKVCRVGTGLKLKEVATFFNTDPTSTSDKHPNGRPAKGKNSALGVTVPHGECPMVGIGGHSQTGGYGHIVRNFGLCIDYVYGYRIVTADGAIREVTRDSADQADKDLYWAVAGGSPGAFGVTTELIIHPICDEDWPDSTAYDAQIPYSPERMRATLKILEDFINRAKEDDENALAEGIDLMVSLSTGITNRLISDDLDVVDDSIKVGEGARGTVASLFPFLSKKISDPYDDNVAGQLGIAPSIILFELEIRDMKDEKAYAQFCEFRERFRKEVKTGIFGLTKHCQESKYENEDGSEQHFKLSELSLYFTRKAPVVTADGRENRRPYNKACYGSNDQLTEGWADSFADLLKDIKEDDKIHSIFQVVVGGGAQTRNGKANLNSIAHRDVQLCGTVLDLFRDEEPEATKAATAFQNRFELDVVDKHQTAYPKVMAQWASHGDLDTTKKQVWQKYWGASEKDEVNYHRLRQIKKTVDPKDVFQSRFTLRPAED